jgi:hypothetical protein
MRAGRAWRSVQSGTGYALGSAPRCRPRQAVRERDPRDRNDLSHCAISTQSPWIRSPSARLNDVAVCTLAPFLSSSTSLRSELHTQAPSDDHGASYGAPAPGTRCVVMVVSMLRNGAKWTRWRQSDSSRLFRELGRTRGRGSSRHHARNLAAYLPQPAAYGHPEPRTTAQALRPLAVGGAASSQATSAFAKARAGGAGGDRTHDRRIMRMPHRLAGSPTSAFVAAVASALPQSARFARLPLPRSLPANPITAQRERRVGLPLTHQPQAASHSP